MTVSMVSSSNPRWLKSLAIRPGVFAEVVRPAIVTSLHSEILFTYLAVGGLYRCLHNVFRTTGGEQLFLQARTPHRHPRESPIGPPRSEGHIVEVPQHCQPPNDGSYLRGRRPLRLEQSFDLRRRTITAGQRTHRQLQPLILRMVPTLLTTRLLTSLLDRRATRDKREMWAREAF